MRGIDTTHNSLDTLASALAFTLDHKLTKLKNLLLSGLTLI